MDDTQYDQFHVIDGVPVVSWRTKTGANYLEADSFLQDNPEGAVYIVGNNNVWWQRQIVVNGYNTWGIVPEPKFLAMYRLVNH